MSIGYEPIVDARVVGLQDLDEALTELATPVCAVLAHAEVVSPAAAGDGHQADGPSGFFGDVEQARIVQHEVRRERGRRQCRIVLQARKPFAGDRSGRSHAGCLPSPAPPRPRPVQRSDPDDRGALRRAGALRFDVGDRPAQRGAADDSCSRVPAVVSRLLDLCRRQREPPAGERVSRPRAIVVERAAAPAAAFARTHRCRQRGKIRCRLDAVVDAPKVDSGAPPMAFLNVKLIHSLCSLWPPNEDEYIAEMIRPLTRRRDRGFRTPRARRSRARK